MEHDHKNKGSNHFSALQWACRRGMLELDVLLGNFLTEVYPSLHVADQQSFEHLLEVSDPALMNWLIGHQNSPEKKFHRMIQLIRQHAKSRI